MKLNYRDWLDWVLSMTKTRQDNDVNNLSCVVYAEKEIELSWSIMKNK